jgi:hypothetical protein
VLLFFGYGRRKSEDGTGYIPFTAAKGKFYTLYENLHEDPIYFFSNFRMNISTFDELIRLVGPAVSYLNTNFQLCIPKEERMAVTIR